MQILRREVPEREPSSIPRQDGPQEANPFLLRNLQIGVPGEFQTDEAQSPRSQRNSGNFYPQHRIKNNLSILLIQ